MNANTATNAYTKVGIESGVNGADPHKLITMLFQGALLAIANAKNAMLRKDFKSKGDAISKAMLIIDEGLKASLDKKVGGELAQSLDQLYDYVLSRLFAANINNDAQILDEVSRLLSELKGAWDAIRQTALTNAPVQSQPLASPNKQPALVYGRM
ncbi:MAG: flagellar export chaperone FliS [Sideroxydans sp.]|jgi:flagellar protein FliS